MIGYQSFFQAQLTAGISDTDTNIPLDNVPTPSEGFLVIEPNTSAREIIYYTSKDSSSVTVPSGLGNGRGYDGTTASAHLQNADVIMAPVAAMFETLQDGTAIAEEAITTAKLADGAVTPEKVLAGTGTSWVWQGWTPTYTGIAVGNGTVVAKYIQIGKTVHFNYQFTIGSTSSVSNSFTVSLPVAAASRYSGVRFTAIGSASTYDITGVQYPGVLTIDDSTTVCTPRWSDTGGSALQSNVFPYTEATGDFVTFVGTYEAA